MENNKKWWARLLKKYFRKCPGGPVVRTLCIHCWRPKVGSLVRELRSCKPHSLAKKFFKNSLKILKRWKQSFVMDTCNRGTCKQYTKTYYSLRAFENIFLWALIWSNVISKKYKSSLRASQMCSIFCISSDLTGPQYKHSVNAKKI